MSHVTLVRGPSVTQEASLMTDISAVGAPPLGLAYLAGALEQAGHTVCGIDAVGLGMGCYVSISGVPLVAHGLDIDEIVARIPANTDLVGVSCMFSSEWIVYRKLINAICDALPGVPVVLGGEHATADYEYVLSCCPGLTACALGEGEETIVELVEALRDGKDLEGVPGLAYLDDSTGKVVQSSPRQRKRNLDELAWPSWDHFPIQAYLDTGLGHGVAYGRVMPMLASRGCPYKCTFCSNSNMWGKIWNTRSPEDVIAEMKHYIGRYGVTHVTFWDLTLIVNRTWVLRFLHLLVEEDLGIEWSMPSGSRSEAFDAELARLLVQSKFKKFSFAPETGSKQELRRIQKKVDLDRMVEAIRICSSEGLVTKAHIIMNFPETTWWDIIATYWYIIRMTWAGLNDCPVYMFHPYPGTVLHRQLLEQGKLPPRGAEYDAFMAVAVYTNYRQSHSWNERIGGRTFRVLGIVGMTLHYGSQFLFRPWRAVRSMVLVARGTPTTMLERLPGVMWARWRAFTASAVKQPSPATEPADAQWTGAQGK